MMNNQHRRDLKRRETPAFETNGPVGLKGPNNENDGAKANVGYPAQDGTDDSFKFPDDEDLRSSMQGHDQGPLPGQVSVTNHDATDMTSMSMGYNLDESARSVKRTS